MRQLRQYRWGNIRELHNLVERLIISRRKATDFVADLPEYLNVTVNPADAIAPGSKSLARVREIAGVKIETASKRTTQRDAAAKLLGMERAISIKMKSLGIQ